MGKDPGCSEDEWAKHFCHFPVRKTGVRGDTGVESPESTSPSGEGSYESRVRGTDDSLEHSSHRDVTVQSDLSAGVLRRRGQ